MTVSGNGIPLEEKETCLKEILFSCRRVLIAFSGGCDSSLLVKAALDTLGRERVLAVTARSESLARREIGEVDRFVREHRVVHEWIESRELTDADYAANPVNRCFFCKTELYTRLRPVAEKNNFQVILNGTNADDLSDWRPGIQAARDFEVKSPLAEAGLHKSEIRELSRKYGLRTWDKPAAPCLSSRLPYGERVTESKLRQIDEGEEIVRASGFRVVRLRHYGAFARLEVGADEVARFDEEPGLRERISAGLTGLGFDKVEIDLSGYRQGKLNTHLKES